MMMSKKKQRHQVKSRWYYIFWGAATVSVFAGQIFVGNGFRRMAEAVEECIDRLDRFGILIEAPAPRKPMTAPPDGMFLGINS